MNEDTPVLFHPLEDLEQEANLDLVSTFVTIWFVDPDTNHADFSAKVDVDLLPVFGGHVGQLFEADFIACAALFTDHQLRRDQPHIVVWTIQDVDPLTHGLGETTECWNLALGDHDEDGPFTAQEVLGCTCTSEITALILEVVRR